MTLEEEYRRVLKLPRPYWPSCFTENRPWSWLWLLVKLRDEFKRESE